MPFALSAAAVVVPAGAAAAVVGVTVAGADAGCPVELSDVAAPVPYGEAGVVLVVVAGAVAAASGLAAATVAVAPVPAVTPDAVASGRLSPRLMVMAPSSNFTTCGFTFSSSGKSSTMRAVGCGAFSRFE